MSHKKFGPNDIFINRVKMHPEWDFFIYNSEVFINNSQNISGSHSENYKGVPAGFLSLYEYNINRTGSFIYPYIEPGNADYKKRFKKDLNNLTGKRKDSAITWNAASNFGADILTGSYKMSASITRKFLEPDVTTLTGLNHTSSVIKNMCRQYQTINPSFKTANSTLDNLFTADVNMINVPSVFYGSEIKKGTIELNYYITGTLIATAKDERQNGQLLCTFGTGSVSGSVVGHVLYREGILFFPSSSAPASTALDSGNGIRYNNSINADAKWIYFGHGANDGAADNSHVSASYSINFEGTTYKNTMTMFCHAEKGELNYSNNPTFKMIQHSSSIVSFSSGSYTYSDRETQLVNVASSSFYKGEDDFRKVTYISKVGVYDENDNLLMTVDLARPYKKEEDNDLTFKIKYDLL